LAVLKAAPAMQHGDVDAMVLISILEIDPPLS